MLLTLTTTYRPATDLGYLLHKHPDRFQSVDLSVGQAHIFYPESSEERCTAVLMLDIDPVDLVRGARNLSGKSFSLGQYVNDRSYVASSFLSVALSKAFSSAMNGRCKDRPELVNQPLPLTAKLAVLPAPNGGEALIRRIFEPLGYQVAVQRHPLDEQFPAWGKSKYYTLELSHHIPLKDLLSHLYVLIPALDQGKHYYVNQEEIDKLLDKGAGWLDRHPEKELITQRYLLGLRSLARQALDRLREGDGTEEEVDMPTEVQQRKESLHQQRLRLVLEQLKASGAESVIDLGCGEGKLLRLLLREKQFTRIVGMDISYQELTRAKERMHWDEMAPKQRERIALFQGALTYQDSRLSGFDAAALVEVIEHLDENRLSAFERVVFELAKPQTVVLTTPNAEYNAVFESLPAGQMRHDDHRFEWTRAQLQSWATQVADTHGYRVTFFPIGPEDEQVGAPSQMAVFTHGN